MATWNTWLSVLVGVITISSVISTQCPSPCKCSPNFLTIHCEHHQLDHIPAGIPTTAHQLFLGSNSLTRLPENSFSTLSNLTQLSLKNNYLVDISPGAFVGLNRLKDLYLTQNSLKIFKEHAFEGLISLQQLYLQQNQLIGIPDLSSMPNLTKLSVANNKLQSMKIDQDPPVTLQSLVFSNNPITEIMSSDFETLKNCSITKVNLARCQLKTIQPGAFSNFPRLQSLSLSYNVYLPLSATINIIKDMVNSPLLFYLDLSGSINEEIQPSMFQALQSTNIKQLSLSHMVHCKVLLNDTFSGLSSLTFLDLSYSDVEDIEAGAFVGLKNLQRLDMQYLSLARVPHMPLPALQKLNINHNRIDTFGSVDYFPFIDCISLTILNCSSSFVREILNSPFRGLTNLEHLDISSNKLASNSIGSKVLAELPNLKTLNLRNNKLTQVINEDKLLFGLNHLEELDLSENQCFSLPDRFFEDVTSLKQLRMNANVMQDIWNKSPGILNGLRNLQYLYLDQCGINNIPKDAFKGVVVLQNITMSHNELSTWTADIFNYSRMQFIDLTSNTISIVNRSSLIGLPSGIALNMQGNPFACFCDLIWFRNQMKTQFNGTVPGLDLVNVDQYQCNTPENMAGKPLQSFDPLLIMKTCNPPPWVIICSVAVSSVLLFVAVLSYVGYKNYWGIKFFWYDLFKTKSSHSQYQHLSGEYDHDVVISYCSSSDDDRKWVMESLINRLDKTEGGRYDVFIEDKVPLGKRGMGALPAIQSSRKCVIVVSHAYTKNRRCMYELGNAMAHSIEDVIVILLESSAAAALPDTIRTQIKEKKHLMWPGRDEEGLVLFWSELFNRINSCDVIV